MSSRDHDQKEGIVKIKDRRASAGPKGPHGLDEIRYRVSIVSPNRLDHAGVPYKHLTEGSRYHITVDFRTLSALQDALGEWLYPDVQHLKKNPHRATIEALYELTHIWVARRAVI